MGQHLIRRDKLGLPQSARDVFVLLEQHRFHHHLDEFLTFAGQLLKQARD
jgi:hypothetical protein